MSAMIEEAVRKIDAETKSFSGGNKEKAISTYVSNTLRNFCRADERFATAVAKKAETLSDCCQEIMQNVGGSISDIEVYRRAAIFYFPEAQVDFKMTITLGEGTIKEVEDPLPRKVEGVTTEDKGQKASTKQGTAKSAGKTKAKNKQKNQEDQVIQLNLF